jgi:hypothetical protein
MRLMRRARRCAGSRRASAPIATPAGLSHVAYRRRTPRASLPLAPCRRRRRCRCSRPLRLLLPLTLAAAPRVRARADSARRGLAHRRAGVPALPAPAATTLARPITSSASLPSLCPQGPRACIAALSNTVRALSPTSAATIRPNPAPSSPIPTDPIVHGCSINGLFHTPASCLLAQIPSVHILSGAP